MFKITAYGVRPIEVEYFKKLNVYDYELNLVADMLDHDNAIETKGSDAVLVRGTCITDTENLTKFKEWGINYVFTRTVGYDHVDLTAADKLGIKVARVPGYSPYAVAELAMSMGVTLYRGIAPAIVNTHNGNFKVQNSYFSREIHSSTIGIIGLGKIGSTEAKLYKGMGARVLSYSRKASSKAQEYAEMVSFEELLKESDILSLHVPYVPGDNDNMIGKSEIEMMKDDAIIINTARAQVVDTKAVIEALDNQTLGGYGTDVLIDEGSIFGKEFNNLSDLPNDDVIGLMNQYPNAIVTPHVGSFTEPALEDMISISYRNFNDVLNNGSSENDLN